MEPVCTSTAAVYFLQLKKDDSLEIAAGISLAFSQTVTVTSSLPVFADITAAWAASVARQVGCFGAQPVRRRRQDKPQKAGAGLLL